MVGNDRSNVAQTASLLYRRLPACGAHSDSNVSEPQTPADCQSALQKKHPRFPSGALVACGLPGYWKFAVFSFVLSCEVTAMPAVTPVLIVTFVEPSVVQLAPSGEWKAVNELPERTDRKSTRLNSSHG